MSAAPNAQSIVREDTNAASDIVIETLTEKHFDAARKIENDMASAGKGMCCGLCPYAWCPTPKNEFEQIYKKDPDRLATYGLAIRQADQLVLGVCKTRQGGQASTWDEEMFHSPETDELYLDLLAVTKEARGKGVGTKLMTWTESLARQRKATRIVLGVVNGNPAKRLYDRCGYVETSSDFWFSSCCLGRPNGQYGSVMMEKKL